MPLHMQWMTAICIEMSCIDFDSKCKEGKKECDSRSECLGLKLLSLGFSVFGEHSRLWMCLLAMASTPLWVFPTPAAVAVRASTRPGRGFRSGEQVPLVFHKNCHALRSMIIRCSTHQDIAKVDLSAGRVEDKDAAVLHAESPSSPSSHHDAPDGNSSGDKFGGWYDVEVEVEKNPLKIAAMQVTAGFLLALGVSLSYFVWRQKLERRVTPSPPTLTQTQLSSVLKTSLHESEHESEHSDYKEDPSEESEATSVRNSFGKWPEKSLQSDQDKVVEREDVSEDFYKNKDQQNALGGEQILSDESESEPQRTVSVPAAKPLISPQDQGKAADGVKDEPQNFASEPGAESARAQVDRMSTPVSSKNEVRLSEREDVEDFYKNKNEQIASGGEQILSDKSDSELQRTVVSVPAAKPLISSQDQAKAADGVKDEPQDFASEPGAESASSQVDRMSTPNSSKNEVRLSARESAPESENSRQETKKTQKEPQPAVLQPRKFRKSQQNKRRASAIQDRRRKVVVPAVVDRTQEQILAVLQALRVVEEGSDPRTICKRRDYARWIVAFSSKLTRSSAYKVFPAMYMEGVTELAFDDVSFNDPDFAYIQGLAEAGLIASNFSFTNGEHRKGAYEYDSDGINFFPDSPVSREDLVSWKIALGRRSLPVIGKEALQAKSGFLDIDRIESTSLPALSVDLDSGENSIIMSAFGLTRRFQPDRAATIGQAAIALACGDSSEVFSEELARFQAEKMADEAVAADDNLQAQKQKELNAFFDEQLSAERQQKEVAQKHFEELKAEFEKVKEERDAEKDVLMKDKAAVQFEKDLLQHLREQVDEQLQSLSMRAMQVSIELEKFEKLRLNSEGDDEELSRLIDEVGVEKQALVKARLWAEDEARQARTHAKALEYTRKRMASGEHHSATKARTEVENFFHWAPLQNVMNKGEDLNVSNALTESWLTILRVLNFFLRRVGEFLRDVRLKTQHYYTVTSSSTGNLLQNVSQKFQDLQAVVLEFSSRVGDGTKKFACECKGEVEKVSQRFKSE